MINCYNKLFELYFDLVKPDDGSLPLPLHDLIEEVGPVAPPAPPLPRYWPPGGGPSPVVLTGDLVPLVVPAPAPPADRGGAGGAPQDPGPLVAVAPQWPHAALGRLHLALGRFACPVAGHVVFDLQLKWVKMVKILAIH